MHILASSALDETHLPFYGRLVRESIDQSDIKGCWCAKDVNLRQYIEADLGQKKTITGVATQGYVAHDNWVASYRLGYSDESNALEWYRENDDERVRLINSMIYIFGRKKWLTNSLIKFGNKAKRRISKWVFQENKARQISRKLVY